MLAQRWMNKLASHKITRLGAAVLKDKTVKLTRELVLAGSLAAVFQGIDANKYCNWCHDINCVPSSFWSCSEKVLPCEAMKSAAGRLT
ncbi:hypothetical protein Sjap_023859 [Stephania japonica]|uniref:Uncharacterized protein n=1 Tax=Stephania japonica TaxID=461633 RepID=A0AAP0EFK0_9MAGN